MENPHSILKKVFGYDSFRPGQEDIVQLSFAKKSFWHFVLFAEKTALYLRKSPAFVVY